MSRWAAFLIALLGLVGQTSRVLAERLTIQRLYDVPSLNGLTATAVRLSPDGRWVGFIRPAASDPEASALWVMPTSGGAPRLVIESGALGKASASESVEAMRARERRYQSESSAIDYRWGADADTVLVSFLGEVYLVSVAGGAPLRVTEGGEGDALDPQLAPGKRYLSYTRGPNLFVRALRSDAPAERVATDASETAYYGRAEFVAQEEIRRFTGQWWSPDGLRLAYTRVDESRVRLLPRLLIGAADTRIANERYPLTGTPNAEIRVFLRRSDGGAPIEVDLGRDKDFYLTRAAWSRDSRILYIERQSRDQKRLDLVAADANTGASHVILSETSPTWVDVQDDFRPLADGSFLWGSAREGNRYLYLYSREGRLIRQVTSGRYRLTNYSVATPEGVQPLAGIDEQRGYAYFGSSPTTPLETELYRVSYRHPGSPQRLTATGGWWLPIMPDRAANVFIATYSDPKTPPQTALYDAEGRRVAWLAENRLDATHPLFPYLSDRPTYDFGSIATADGTPLFYVLAKPADFDPTRRYPVIVRPYGGPGVQTVRHEWRSASDEIWTQAGYLLFFLDNRGMANRDIAFEHALHGRLDTPNMDDQAAGVRFVRALPFVDPDRIGMAGWSFGAYTTVRLLTEPGSGVRAGAAGGTPTDFALYDTYYTERYLGTPQANPEAYREGALLPRLKDLNGDLLLLEGLADDNVVVQNFTAAVAELEAKGKLFETAVYPGMGHVPRGPHILYTQLDFFNRRLELRAASAANDSAK